MDGPPIRSIIDRRPSHISIIDWIFLRGINVGECLEYPRQKARYPAIRVGDKAVKVHRYVFEYFNGPTDLNVCHTCDNTYCFLPDHLFAGTQKDNVDDMIAKGRHWLNDNLCAKKLHELTEDNVYISTEVRKGVTFIKRSCKLCKAVYARSKVTV